MYDLNLDVIGGGPRASTQLSFSQAIFVIEDVDACSHIVRRRFADAALNRTENASAEEGSWSPSSSSTSPVTAASTTLPGEAPPSCRVSPTAATSPLDHGPLPLRFGPPVMLPPPPLPTHPLPPHQLPPHPPAPHPWLFNPHPDELNLAGVLNVLDGVIDTPGRMLVMTSNHPEALDPALIRPGRIDRCLLLGFLQPPEAARMVEHYFGVALTAEQQELLGRSLSGGHCQKTPAEMEQLCAEFDSVDEIIDHLARRHDFGVSDDGSGDDSTTATEGARAAKRARPNGCIV